MKKTCFISAILVVMIFVSLFTVWYSTGQKEYAAQENQKLKQMEQATDNVVAKVQAHLQNSESVLRAVAADLKPERDALGENPYISEAALQKLETVLLTYGFAQIALCDTEGNAYSYADSFSVAECNSYQKALKGTSVFSYQKFSDTDRDKTVVIHVPVGDAGKTEAVIRAAWDAESLDSITLFSDFRRKENIFIIDQNSLILYSAQSKFINDAMFLSLWGERYSDFKDMEQVIKQGREKITFVQDKDGRSYCVAYQGMTNVQDWGVAIVILENDLESIVAPSSLSNELIVPAILALVGVVLLLIILLYQSYQHYHLRQLAYIDGVTKSYNFKGFMVRVHKQFQEDPSAKFAILEVTLDKFDYYTESFGEEARNELLRDLSDLIERWTHGDEAHCRYNTTNFIIFIKYQNEDELKDRIFYLRDKVAAFSKNEKDKERFDYLLQVGLVNIGADERDIDVLLRHADAALLAAKNDRMAPFSVYNAKMESSKSEDREYEERLDQALREKEFLVYLQPKFSLLNGRQVGAEALVRWMHPEKGLLYPGRFIPLFERNGFIAELDMYILENICQRLANWIRKGIQPHPISFNVSMHNLYRETFVDQAFEIIERYGVPARLITFEVGESSVVGNIKLMQETLDRLKERGFMISMDDFGQGTVSLNTLYQVPVDELKIERRFLLETAESSRGQSIINSIIDTSKRLGIHVVAEGVDSKSQAVMLRDLGCDMMQGFVFSEPLPEQEYEEYAYGVLSEENYISL